MSRVITEESRVRGIPGESHTSAGTVGVSEDACGDDLTEGLQHAFQLLLIHRERKVGDVQVGGVLLLLLQKERDVEL